MFAPSSPEKMTDCDDSYVSFWFRYFLTGITEDEDANGEVNFDLKRNLNEWK